MQQVASEAAPIAWVLNGYPWWVHVGVILLTGIFGGLLNAILSGGPTYGVRLGRLSAGENSGTRMLHSGVWGSILVGIGAALAAWGTGFHQTPLPAMIAGPVRWSCWCELPHKSSAAGSGRGNRPQSGAGNRGSPGRR